MVAAPALAVTAPELDAEAVEKLVASDNPGMAQALEAQVGAFAAQAALSAPDLAIARAARARLLHLQARFDEANAEHDALLQRLPAEVRARPALYAQILYNDAETKRAKEDWGRAEASSRLSLGLRQTHGTALDRADSEVQLAVILLEQERFGEAEPLFTSAASMRNRLLGPGAAKSVNIRAWMARSLTRQKRHADALPLLAEVVSARRPIGDRQALSEALSDHAAALEAVQRPEEAESLRREVVKLAGQDGPVDAAWARTDLAANLLLQSRWADTIAELEPALAVLRKEDDLTILDFHQAWVDLAFAQEKLGRWSDAFGLHTLLVDTIEKVRPDDAALLADALAGLARNRREGGDAAAALSAAERARRLSEGADRTLRGRILRELAATQLTAKRFADAERTIDEALSLSPTRGLDRANALVVKGSIAAETRRSRDWATAFAEAFAIRKALLPWSDPAVHLLAFDLVAAYQNLTLSAEAESVAREAVEALSGPDNRGPYVRALSRLATVLFDQERFDDAEAAYRALLALTENQPGAGNATQAANAWAGIAQVAESRGDLASAEQAFRKALAPWKALEESPNQQRNVAGISSRLGMALRKAGKLREAESALRDAAERFRAVDGPDDANVAWATWLLADTLAAQGRAAESDRLYRQALAVIRKDEAPVRAIPALTGHGRLALRQMNDPALALARLRDAVGLALSTLGQGTGDEARRDLLRNREIFELSVEAAWAAQGASRP